MIDDVLVLTPHGPGRWQAQADASWFQGRGLYGGLPAAWLAEAGAQAVADPARRLRSLTVHLAAPVPDTPVSVLAEVVRAGANVSQVTGRLLDDADRVLATMVATYGLARTGSPAVGAPEAPALAPPETLPRLPALPGLPTFAREHIDYRYVLGAPPGSSAAPRLGGWARFAEGATPTTAMLVALSDVWPPAILPALDRMRGCATVDLSLNLHEPFADDASPHDAYAYVAEIPQATEGYAEERASLWDRHGRRLLSIRQTVVVFG